MKIIKIKLKKVAWGRQRPRGRRLDSPDLDDRINKKSLEIFKFFELETETLKTRLSSR